MGWPVGAAGAVAGDDADVAACVLSGELCVAGEEEEGLGESVALPTAFSVDVMFGDGGVG
jgi:hypothetical protein